MLFYTFQYKPDTICPLIMSESEFFLKRDTEQTSTLLQLSRTLKTEYHMHIFQGD